MDLVSAVVYFFNRTTGEGQPRRRQLRMQGGIPAWTPRGVAGACKRWRHVTWRLGVAVATGAGERVWSRPGGPLQAAAAGEPDFEESARFAGARPGYVFKTGNRGLGYYRDLGPAHAKLVRACGLEGFRGWGRAAPRPRLHPPPKDACSARLDRLGGGTCARAGGASAHARGPPGCRSRTSGGRQAGAARRAAARAGRGARRGARQAAPAGRRHRPHGPGEGFRALPWRGESVAGACLTCAATTLYPGGGARRRRPTRTRRAAAGAWGWRARSRAPPIRRPRGRCSSSGHTPRRALC